MAIIREKGGLDLLAWLVAALAATNWGIEAILGEGIFMMVGLTGDALTSAYVAVGVFGVINLLSWLDNALDAATGGM